MVIFATGMIGLEECPTVSAGGRYQCWDVAIIPIHAYLPPFKSPSDRATVGDAIGARLMRRATRRISRVIARPTMDIAAIKLTLSMFAVLVEYGRRIIAAVTRVQT